MRRNVSAIAADMAADPAGLGGKGAGQDHGGEGEFGQDFHNFYFVVCCRRGFVLNRLHPLHRKRRAASYNYFWTRISRIDTDRDCSKKAL
jgi:hypothetical protein